MAEAVSCVRSQRSFDIHPRPLQIDHQSRCRSHGKAKRTSGETSSGFKLSVSSFGSTVSVSRVAAKGAIVLTQMFFDLPSRASVLARPSKPSFIAE